MTRALGFRLVILSLSLIILGFEVLLYKRWKLRVGDRSWFKYARALFWSMAALAHTPFTLMILLGRKGWTTPLTGAGELLYYIVVAWSYTMLFFTLVFVLKEIIRALGKIVLSLYYKVFDIFGGERSGEAKALNAEENAQADGVDPQLWSRREILSAALDSLPVMVSAGAISGMVLGSREVQTQKVQVRIANLHEDLKGLRIVQISDIHIGNLIHEAYLDMAAGIIKDLKGDILVATGDIIDNNNYFIGVAGRFFRKLESMFPMGVYGILGNHDHIDNPGEIFQKLPGGGIRLLNNESLVLNRGKGELNLLGMDYPGRLFGPYGKRMQTSHKYFLNGKKSKQPEIPTVVLNHHPTDFVFLQKEEVDLVLSGHTHGGQINFSEEQKSPLNIASQIFPYVKGLYSENERQMYVNSGLGHWFPLRINCPAEITLIELV